jgi:hypothetical protein
MKKPLFDKVCLLKKYPGKGGWTYAEIPKIKQNKNSSSGWLKVKGKIDDFDFSDFNLAPMGNGKLFMPVRTEIRKKIRKQAGNHVRIILYADDTIFQIPQELIDCLINDELAHQKFMILKQRHQREFINWIYDAKKDETKVRRINVMIDKVLKGKALYEM